MNNIDNWLTEILKVCTGCKRKLPLSCYQKNKSRPDGFHYYCRECVKNRDAGYYLRNAESEKEKKRIYFKSENGKQTLLRSVKKQRELHPEKHKAKNKLGAAVRQGKIIKPDACSMCSATDKKIEDLKPPRTLNLYHNPPILIQQ